MHAALIGEPETTKSDLLEYIRDVTPHARSANASGSSFVSLLSSADREEIAGKSRWVLKAGELAIASGGVLTLDELDKVEFEAEHLNEALTQKEVRVSKVGISTPVQTDCALLAAANPESDTLDPCESLEDQLNFDSSLLTRFDLTFAFQDTMGEKRNRGIADAGMNKYLPNDLVDKSYTPTINRGMVTKWIHLARQQDIVFTRDAAEYIRDKFFWLRQEAAEGGAITVGPRRRDSLFRLAAAHTRARLSNTVEQEDAEVAVQFMVKMLSQWGYDLEGEIEIETAGSNGDDDGGDMSSADTASNTADETEQNRGDREWSIKESVYKDNITDADVPDHIVAQVDDYIADHPEAGVEDVLDGCDLYVEFTP